MENQPQAGGPGSFTPLPTNVGKGGKSGGSKKNIVMILVVVLLVVAAGAGGFLLYQYQQAQQPVLEMPQVEAPVATPTPSDELSGDDSVETIEEEIDQTTVETTPVPAEEETLQEDVNNL